MTPRCRICGSETRKHFEHAVLGRHVVSYFACPVCRFVQTEDPYWLAEAYADPLSALDTGLVFRTTYLVPRLSALLLVTGNRHGKCVDAGGGCGLLTRMMRDVGFDFYWQDKYCENLLARGFEADAIEGSTALVTAIEVLEHTVDPLAFLRELDRRHSPRIIVLSTQVFDGEPPPPAWRYYEFQLGQHVSLFSAQALRRAAGAISREVMSFGQFHLLVRERIARPVARLAMSRLADYLFPLTRAFLEPRFEADYQRVSSRSGSAEK